MNERTGTRNARGNARAYVKVGAGPTWDEADPESAGSIIDEVERVHAPIWDHLPRIDYMSPSRFTYEIGSSRAPDSAAFIGAPETGLPMRAVIKSSRLRPGFSRKGMKVLDGVIAAVWADEDASPVPPGPDDRLLREILQRLSHLESRFDDRDKDVRQEVRRVTGSTHGEVPLDPLAVAVAARRSVEAMLRKVRRRLGMDIPAQATIETLNSGLPGKSVPAAIRGQITVIQRLTNTLIHVQDAEGDNAAAEDPRQEDSVRQILMATLAVTEWFVTSGNLGGD